MKREFDDKLCADFPLLYADRRASPSSTNMVWGFPGDGWEPLIRRLSEKLEAEIKAEPEGKRRQYKAFQVKEKFGSLVFYLTSYTPRMTELIAQAQTESETVCEECGAPGKRRGKFWFYVACDEHSKAEDR